VRQRFFARPLLAAGARSGSVDLPRVDELDAEVGEVIGVTGHENAPMASTDGSDLRVSDPDGPPEPFAGDDDPCVVPRRRLVERQK
jgi:hypothetical protein